MHALDLVRLTPVMRRTSGNPATIVGLIDGPIATHLPGLAQDNIRDIPGQTGGSCVQPDSAACAHGTLVAGMLIAKRGSDSPGICPGCTLISRPIFAEAKAGSGSLPEAAPGELAKAIIEIVDAGARVINLSVGLSQATAKGEQALEQALDYAAARGAIVVVAGGNQGTIGGSILTRHPWVIPVAAFNLAGSPTGYTNLSHSMARRGLGAPGEQVTSLGPDGKLRTFGGTSAAAPFVTGTVALLWSEFSSAPAGQIRLALAGGDTARRAAIVPPLLDAWSAYEFMAQNQIRG